MFNLSNLQKLVLLYLSTKPHTGYEISKKIQAGTVLPANHQRVYRDLRILEDHGFVSHTVEPQDGKPDKKICSLTCNGQQAVDGIRTETSINAHDYRGEYTLMLKALNTGYFIALSEQLAVQIFDLSQSQSSITDDIEFTLQYRTTCLLRAELDFTKSALVAIKYEKKRLERLSK